MTDRVAIRHLSTGVPGLDQILGGGGNLRTLPGHAVGNHVYRLQRDQQVIALLHVMPGDHVCDPQIVPGLLRI